jgi:DNA processing protein
VGGDRVDERAIRERAALVALLRERPGRRGWAEITAEVLEAGSAVAVWQRLVPPVLVSPLDRAGMAGADHPR